MNERKRTVLYLLPALILSGFIVSTHAQEVSIPDPGLNAAMRETLQKPAGPLTEQDLLSLTVLNASRRNVSSIAGLEAARNLVSLDLQINRLTNFSQPGFSRPRLQFIHQFFPGERADKSHHVLFRRQSTNQRHLASGACRHDGA